MKHEGTIITDKDGNRFVAKRETDGCEGCVFNGEICCSSPESAHCDGLIYEQATSADIDERNSWDKYTIWLIVITIIYLSAFVAFFAHFFSKLN
jgi:hypothetical protein